MVNCPSCKQEFPAANIWAEVFQAKELETKRFGQLYHIHVPSLPSIPGHKRKGVTVTLRHLRF